MICKRCRRRKCVCKKPRVISTTPEVVKVQTVPVPGEPGDTPYVGINGNWWIGGQDTGIPAQGPQGDIIEPVTSDNITF